MDITDIISNVGFPIAISIALFYQLIQTNEIVREFQSTIDRNTATMNKVLDELEERYRREGI